MFNKKEKTQNVTGKPPATSGKPQATSSQPQVTLPRSTPHTSSTGVYYEEKDQQTSLATKKPAKYQNPVPADQAVKASKVAMEKDGRFR